MAVPLSQKKNLQGRRGSKSSKVQCTSCRVLTVVFGLIFWEAVNCVLGNFEQVCALCIVKQIGKTSREDSCLLPRICRNTA